jgi:hypothetical protein
MQNWFLNVGNILHKENNEHIPKGYKTEISKILCDVWTTPAKRAEQL